MAGTRGAAACRSVGRRTFVQLGVALAFAAAIFVFSLMPGAARQAAADSAKPELVAQTSLTNTYRNPDGSFTRDLFAAPVNFQNGAGRWQSIDSTLVPSTVPGYMYGTRANDFHVLFKGQLGESFMGFQVAGGIYNLSLKGAAARTAQASGTTVRYPSALAGADLAYHVRADGVEEFLTLHSPSAPTAYHFTLTPPAGVQLNAKALPGGAWMFTVPGKPKPAFLLAPPRAVDANGKDGRQHASIEVARTGSSYAIQLGLDPAWLHASGRAFPVVVDPTITLQPSAMTGNFDVSCATCTDTATPLWTGVDDTDVWRTLLRFDLSSLPAGSQITNATVGLWNDSANCVPVTNQNCEVSSHTLELHRMTSAWDNVNTQSNQLAFDSTVLSTATLAANAPDQWVNWNATSLVQNWANGTQPNYGVLIKRSTEPQGAGGPAFPGNDASDPTQAPKLTVTYKGDGVILDQPGVLHGSGADLHWSKWDGSSGNPFGGYEVHRSTDPNFTASAANLVTTIGDPAITSYTDTSAKPSTTFTYKIVVNGVASTGRTVTLPADGQTTTSLMLTSANSQATYLENDSTTTDCSNYGGTDSMLVGADGDSSSSTTYRPILSFDLRGIPATATVTNATLKLYGDMMPPTRTVNVEAHRVTGAWKQGTGGTAAATTTCTGDGATWFESDGGVTWHKPGGDFDPAVAAYVTHTANDAAGWDSFNIASIVQQWVNGSAPNLGVLFKFNDETPDYGNWFAYYTGAYTWDPTLHPQLVLTYTDGNHTQPPTVAVSSPANGDNVGGTVHVTAAASDDGHVAKVDFQVDGAQAATATTAPFAFDWNSATVGAGQHTLRTIATDDAGNTTTSSNVTVNVDNSAAPTTSITGPVQGGTVSGTATVTANAADDRAVSHVEFYVDSNRFADTTTSPYSVPLNTTSTTDQVYDGTHSLTTKAYDAGGHVTTSAPVTITVANAPTASEYAATITSTDIPQAVTYDPAAPTQQQSGFNVSVKNTSTVTWPAANVVLQPRWVSSDPTPTYIDGTQVPLTSDLAPGASQTLTATVTPPTLPDGVDRAQYTLRFDLYDKSAGHWFADEGNQPLDNPVIVNKALVRDALGLERYYHYVGQDVGGGFQQLTNVANGNSLLRFTPFDEPGRGLATVLDLTYNALEKKCDCPTGNNWSLAISSLTRFGQPLDIHPNKADQIAGGSNKYIEFTDGDGTTHRFADTNSDGYWEAPAGVHLYLRQYSTTDTTKYWALTRPDRVTFYYDQDGFPTSVSDASGNTIAFTESAIAPGDDPGGPKEHVTKVTDAGGRSFTISYYTKADAKKPQIRGKVQDITDHVGRTLHFDYYFDGNLLRITQRGGTNADGTYLADRSWVFTYTTSAGGGPAISDPNARVNPDQKTSDESTRLYSIRDPRGRETTFAYLGSGNGTDRWKLASITDRAGNQTSFAYDTTNRITTVTEPLSRVWQYGYDVEGKVTTITNPLRQSAQIAWSADRQVSKVTEPSGAATSYTYNDNGYLTSQTDQLGNTTKLTYQDIAVDGNDTSAHWESGRATPHISQLATKQSPKGVAAGSGHQWTFAYDANGNPTSVTDPLGDTTTNAYNSDGTLTTTTDPNGHANTMAGYDGNGFPGSITDADSNVTQFGYDAAGDLVWVQDANHASQSGGNPPTYRNEFYYDSFGRLARQSTPKSFSQETGTLIWTDASYDMNDNVVSEQAPHYGPNDGMNGAATATTYDPLDRATQTASSDTSVDPNGQRTQYVYDGGGRLTDVTLAKGVMTATANDYMTHYDYDLLDRVIKQTQYPDTGATTGSRVSNYCYDLAGDLRSVTAPLGSTTFTSCPAATAPYTPLSVPYTSTLSYDAAHHELSGTDALSRTRSQTYDADGKVVSTTDAMGNKATIAYDQLDRPIIESHPFDSSATPIRNVVAELQYDPAGNVVKEISPRAYDASPDKSTFSDYVTSYHYDAADRLVRTDLPTAAGSTPLYTYQSSDHNGNVTQMSLPVPTLMAPASVDMSQIDGQHKTVDTYFDPGWIRTSNDPSDPTVHFDYTAKGWQDSRTPERGDGTLDLQHQMLWDYTAQGQVAKVTDQAQSGDFSTYTYDANGNLVSGSEGQGVYDPSEAKIDVTATYNGFDEPLTVKQRKANTNNWSQTSYAYDLNGNMTSLADNATVDGNGATVDPGDPKSFSYDSAGQVQWEIDNGPTSSTTDDRKILDTYNLDGLPTQQELDNSNGSGGWTAKQQTNWTYFANGLAKSQTTKNGSGTVLESHTASYLDPNGNFVDGNLTSDTFTMNGVNAACGPSAPCAATYGYDSLDRLVNYADGHGTTTSYTLDPAGNITKQVVGATTTTTTFTYTGARLNTETAQGAISKFVYDDNGNLSCVTNGVGSAADCGLPTGGTPSPNLLASYTYDDLNRLQAYRAYDGAGHKTTDTKYVYDALNRTSLETETHGDNLPRTTTFSYLGLSGQLSQEHAGGAAPSTRTYAYDPFGDAVGISNNASGSTSTYTYGYNLHGDVSELISSTGSASSTYGYTPYGSPDSALTKTVPGVNDATTGSDPQPINPLRYSGFRFDTGSGTIDMGARRYGPDTQHFLQQDQFAGALDDLSLSTDPLTGNRYGLAGANPINFIETDGHSFCHYFPLTCHVAQGLGDVATASYNVGKSAANFLWDVTYLIGGDYGGCENDPQCMSRVGQMGAVWDMWSHHPTAAVKAMLRGFVSTCVSSYHKGGVARLAGCVTGEVGLMVATGGFSRALRAGEDAGAVAGGVGGVGPVNAGKVGVALSIASHDALGEKLLGTEITVDTAAGRARIDAIFRDANGRLVFVESKNGKYAVASRNQENVFAAIRQLGGVFVGNNARRAGLLGKGEASRSFRPRRVLVEHW